MNSVFNGIPTNGLRALVQTLKNTFIAACGIFFVFSCFEPDVGFLDAQAELTILTFIIPIYYTLIYLAMKMASKISINLLLYGVPVAAFSAAILCKVSAFGGPGTLLLVTLHIYRKFVLLYGHPEPFEECDTPEYGSGKPLKASSSLNDGGGIRKDHRNLSFEEDTTSTEEPHNITTSGELIPESSPQMKDHHRQKVRRSRRTASARSMASRSPISDVLSSSPPVPRSAYLMPPNVSSITKSINTSARSLMHNIAEVLPSSLEGTNSVFVYKGLVNLMIALIVICGLFITLFEVYYRDMCVCVLSSFSLLYYPITTTTCHFSY